MANEVGSYVQWTVNEATAGTGTLTFRYASPPNLDYLEVAS
jgi:hypothetical protein